MIARISVLIPAKGIAILNKRPSKSRIAPETVVVRKDGSVTAFVATALVKDRMTTDVKRSVVALSILLVPSKIEWPSQRL